MRPVARAVAFALLAGVGHAWAGPTGEQVVAGQASVSRSGTNTLVTQGTDRAAINWLGFDIGADESVRFAQPSASSIALNRVLGQNPSEIFGSLTANGQVFILNPNGVLFGKGAQVDVAGLVASTLSLSNEDFMAGRYRFTASAAAGLGEVANQGDITANGGYVALIGPQVRNAGTITAANGSVALAAGNEVTVNLNGNKLIGLVVDLGTLNALVDNKGIIRADGGQVLLSAKAADQIIKSVVNNDGIIEATRLTNVDGVIRLEADNITNSGTLRADGGAGLRGGSIMLAAANDITLGTSSIVSASGTRGGDITAQAQAGTLLADGRIEVVGSEAAGGTVKLLGNQVGLINSASVDASGSTGGGTVLMGGDYQGKNSDVQNAQQTYLSPDATISADATNSGNGGKVILWSDQYTGFYGAISARGGASAGNGGFVETSSKDNLQAFGSVDASALFGNSGTWLLDPFNVAIVAATAGGAFGGGNPNVFTPTANNATVNNATINTSLNGGTDVTITTGAAGAQAGTITQTNAITKSAGANATLTLTAAGAVALNNSITSTTGQLNVVITSGAGGNVIFQAGGSPGTITSNGGNVTVNASGAVTFTAGGANFITSGGGNVSLTAGTTATLGNITTGTGTLGVSTNGAITQNAGTALTVGGASTFSAGANAITLTQANNFTGAVSLNNSGANNVAVTDANALVLGTSNVGTGTLGITAGGTISETGAITQAAGAGTTTITLTAANSDVLLNTAANNFSGPIAFGGTLGNVRDLGLRNTNAGATVPTLSTLTSLRNLTLQFDNAGVALPAATLHAGGNLAVTAGGAVTQTGAVTVPGTTSVNAGANAITLTQAANSFTGAVSLNNSGANNVNLTNNIATQLGASSVGSGTLTVTSNGAITQTGALTQAAAAGAATFNAGANAITLTNAANDFTGPVNANNSGANAIQLTDANAIQLGAITTANNLTVNAAGITQNASGLTVGGSSTFNGGAGVITLGTAANSFTGAVSLNNSGANNVSLTNNRATVLGTSAVGTGTLTVTSNGAITQTGALTQAAAAGAATFNAGANAITLTNAANDFTGAVSLNNSGANNVAVTDANALVLGTSNVGTGTLGITAGGTISETGAITQAAGAGTTTITLTAANSDVLLNTAANNFSGPIAFGGTLGNVRDLGLRNTNAGATVPTLSTLTSLRNLTLQFDNAGVALPAATLHAGGNLAVTAGGAVTQTGAVTVPGTTSVNAGANAITLTQAANSFTGAVSLNNSGANNVNLTNNIATQLGASSVGSGTLTVTSNGAITQTGALTQAAAAGAATFNAGANAITLTNAANDFTGPVTLNNSGANNVAVTDANAIVLGASNVGSGTLTVTSNGAITQTGALTQAAAAGAATFNAGANAITLINAANDFTGAVSLNNSGANNVAVTDANAIVLGASNVGSGTLTVTATGANSITQTGAIVQAAAAGTASFTTGAGPITLTNAGNDFTGAVNANNSGANAIQLTDANAIQLGAITTANNLTVNAAGITQNASGLTVGGSSTFNGGAGVITLGTAANSFTGAVSLNNSGANNVTLTNGIATQLAASGVGSGTLTVNSTGGNITQSGALTQAAGAGAATFNAGAHAITLTNAANDFTGAVSLNNSGANNVAVTDANAIVLGASNVGSGTLTVTATGANSITQTGAIVQAAGAGTASFTTGAGPITLTNAANDFTGVVNANNSGANAIQLTDANAIQLGAITTANNLTVNAAGITQNASGLTVGGSSTFNGGAGVITLGTAANSFTGAVSLNNSGANNVSLTNNRATVLGTSAVGTGTLTVTSNGAITQTGALTQAAAAGAATFNAGANAITLTNAANDFTGAVSLNNSGANNVAVTDANAIVLGASNVGSGTLTVTATGANSITQTGAIVQAAAAGTASFTTGAGPITLTNAANDFTGSVALTNTGNNNIAVTDANTIQLGNVSMSAAGTGGLTVNASGAITQAGGTNISTGTGASSFNAGAGAITLTNATNDFRGAVSLNNSGANNVAITDATGLVLGASNVGTGTFTASAVGITQSGALVQAAAAGAATFNGGAGVITLTQANDFTGVVNANNSGANAIQLTDTNAIQLGAVSTTNNLTVNAVGITQNASGLSVGGSSTFNGGAGVITLGTAANSLTGAVSLNNSGANNVTLTNSIATQLAASGVGSGTLTVNSTGGNITQSGALTQAAGAGAATFNAGAHAITLTNAANDFTGAVSLNNSGANNASVNDANNLNLGASTVGGSLTATSGGTLTLTGSLTAGAAGDSIVLAAAQDFVNNVGPAALNPGPGRWLVYSTSPAGSTENGLTGAAGSALPRLYDRTFAGNPPASITEPGNHLIYSFQPTLTPDSKSKVYGTNDPTQTFTGFVSDDGVTDTATTAGLTGSIGRNVGELVGSYSITSGTLASGAGYAISLAGAPALAINPAALTVDLTTNASKTYGANDPSVNATTPVFTGRVNATVTDWNGNNTAIDDTVAGAITLASLTRTAGENVGSYNVLTGTAGGTTVGNYTPTVNVNGHQLAITPASLTATVADQTKIYGTNDPSLNTIAVTLGPVVNTTVTDWNGTATAINDTGNVSSTLASLTRAAGENVTGSPYGITGGSLNALTGTAAGNYTASLDTTGNTLTITPAGLTGTIANQTKIYGTNDPSLNTIAVTLGPVVNTTVTDWNGTATAINDTGNVSSTLASLTRAAGENVTGSPYGITGGSLNALTGTAAGNYTASLDTTGNTLTITPAGLTGTIANQTKIYGTNDPSLNTIAVTLGPVVNTTVTDWNGTATAINDTGNVSSTLASLTRAAGENVTGSPYGITGGSLNALTGTAAGNYTASLDTTGNTLTITPAGLTGTIANQTKIYGTNDPSLNTIAVTLGPVVNTTVTDWNGTATAINDTGNVSSTLASLTRAAGENVTGSPYGITGGSLNALTGTAAGNYTASLDTTGNTLTITPAGLTGTIANQTKIYGTNDPDPTFGGIGMTLAGLVNNPAVVTWNGTVVVNDSAVTGSAASLTRTGGENVGSYNITNGSATLSASGGNYAQSFSAANSPALAITSAALTVDLTTNVNKTYGTNDPNVNTTTPVFTGRVNTTVTDWNGTNTAIDDTAAGAVTLASLTRNAGENVGSYNVLTGTAGGTAIGNYTPTVNVNGHQLTINPAALTVSLTNPAQTKVYGANDPTLGGIGMTLTGLVNNPAVSTWNGTVAVNDSAVTGTAASLTRGAGETVGSYNVTNGSATLSASGGNYTQSFSAANGPVLAITPAALTVSLTNPAQTKVYGANDPALSGIGMTLTGLVNNAAVSTWNGTVAVNDSAVTGTAASLTRGAGENVGSYNVTNGSAALSASGGNYTQSFSAANSPVLAITLAPLTITADDKSRPSGLPNPPFTATYSGLVQGANNVASWNGTVTVNDTPASLGGALAFATPATPSSPAGTYSITPSGQTSTNYAITYVDGSLTVLNLTPGQVTPYANQTLVGSLASTYSGDVQLPPRRAVSGPTGDWGQSPGLPYTLPGVQPNARTASSESSGSESQPQGNVSAAGTEPIINGAVRELMAIVNGGVRMSSRQGGYFRYVNRR